LEIAKVVGQHDKARRRLNRKSRRKCRRGRFENREIMVRALAPILHHSELA
jgi:hypothetical protein